jgi:hydroxyethylthiazole kinase-like sugar kinase family protein
MLGCPLLPTAAGNVKGVDSTAASHEALQAAKQLAADYGCIVAVSGATDLVSTDSFCKTTRTLRGLLCGSWYVQLAAQAGQG